MKFTMKEVRELVAETIRQTLTEAKKKGKEIPGRSEESIAAQRKNQTRATGYSHSDPYDFSAPLGGASVPRKQGASGLGNWTTGSKVTAETKLRRLVRMVVAEELRAIRKG